VSTFFVSGSSTGIGEACSLHLHDLGHKVYAGVRRDTDGERLRSRTSQRLVPVIVDVTDAAQVEALAKRLSDEPGGLQGVVNNAGVGKGGPIEFLPLDEWRAQFDVNVFGQLAVTKALLPSIRKGSGRIVFIGSIGGKSAAPLTGPYSASKFAIEAIGETLRHELRPWGISVSVVEPGAIKTEIWGKARQLADRLDSELPPDARELYASHISSARKAIDMQDRRGASPDKVASAVAHALLSRRPKTRYPVGVDARVQSLMVRLLPDRAREAIVRQVAGP
jgi:NAD(P)-dependent dehydrogenase (short-subunit alcohol dehydrogenase family)